MKVGGGMHIGFTDDFALWAGNDVAADIGRAVEDIRLTDDAAGNVADRCVAVGVEFRGDTTKSCWRCRREIWLQCWRRLDNGGKKNEKT